MRTRSAVRSAATAGESTTLRDHCQLRMHVRAALYVSVVLSLGVGRGLDRRWPTAAPCRGRPEVVPAYFTVAVTGLFGTGVIRDQSSCIG